MKNIVIFLFFSIGLMSARVSSAQSWRWARGSNIYAITHGYNAGFAVATDSHGNIYTVANFIADSVTFGSFTVASGAAHDTVNNYGAITKYDSAGHVLWAKYVGG